MVSFRLPLFVFRLVLMGFWVCLFLFRIHSLTAKVSPTKRGENFTNQVGVIDLLAKSVEAESPI